ncbi:MAG: ribonuclease P protein component [Planctomycetota bacterium]|nr:MAG: ribonuclease P protein component [Planctomycetota bacterium]
MSSDLPAPNDHRFPPSARLHTRREYGRVFYRQQKASARHLVLLLTPRQGKSEAQRPRLGIMVSTKVHKRAVRRHQLKRWVREWFRTTGQHHCPGHDMVVLFRSDPPADGHHRLIHELDHLLRKALAATPQPGSGRPRKKKGRVG